MMYGLYTIFSDSSNLPLTQLTRSSHPQKLVNLASPTSSSSAMAYLSTSATHTAHSTLWVAGRHFKQGDSALFFPSERISSMKHAYRFLLGGLLLVVLLSASFTLPGLTP